MTIFEKIKAMSIDEMAKAIDDDFPELMEDICTPEKECPYMDEEYNISVACDCTGCIKECLESEVE